MDSTQQLLHALCNQPKRFVGCFKHNNGRILYRFYKQIPVFVVVMNVDFTVNRG